MYITCSHAVHGMVPWYLHVQRTCYYMITCMVPCRWSCRAYPPTTSPERASAGHPVDASLESRTQGVMTSCHPAVQMHTTSCGCMLTVHLHVDVHVVRTYGVPYIQYVDSMVPCTILPTLHTVGTSCGVDAHHIL